MADSTGIDAATGGALSDWSHVEQSIRKILTTPVGSRLMRRTFGSEVPDMVDRKMTGANILRVYSAAAEAIAAWEPRFRMSAGRLNEINVRGQMQLEIFGTYYPRGHLGDFSIAETASTRVVFGGAL